MERVREWVKGSFQGREYGVEEEKAHKMVGVVSGEEEPVLISCRECLRSRSSSCYRFRSSLSRCVRILSSNRASRAAIRPHKS